MCSNPEFLQGGQNTLWTNSDSGFRLHQLVELPEIRPEPKRLDDGPGRNGTAGVIVGLTKQGHILLGYGQGKTKTSRVEPACAQRFQLLAKVRRRELGGQAVDGLVVGPFDKTVARLDHAELLPVSLALDPFVSVDNDLGASEGVTTEPHYHMPPLGSMIWK
jgi:hypothetical protein